MPFLFIVFNVIYWLRQDSISKSISNESGKPILKILYHLGWLMTFFVFSWLDHEMITLLSALAHIFSGSCRRRSNSRTSSLAHYQIRLFVQISFLPFLVNSASVSQSLFLALHSFPPVNSIHESYSFKPGYICDHTARLTN